MSAFFLSFITVVVGAKCSLPACAGNTSPVKPSSSLSGKAQALSSGEAPEDPNDPYKDDVRKARLFIRNRHELEARAILKVVCSHQNASNESRMMYAETFLDFEGAEDSSPGAGEAFDGLKTVIQKDPKNWRAYRDLASVANMRGKYNDAVQLASKAIAIGGNNMATYRQRMLAYTHLQRSDEALKDMAVMLSMQPTTVNYMLQGDTLRGLKRYKEAAASYRNGLAMGGFQYKDRCFNQLFTCLKLAGDYNGAIGELDKRLKTEPDNPEWNDDKGQCQMKLKMFADAVKSFSAAIKAYPIEAYYIHRAEAYEQLGQKALATADRAKGKDAKKDEPPLF
ncbi:MAG TPA: tetratricopeptide repeat protein [Oculatellaceae cyanobacterium]